MSVSIVRLSRFKDRELTINSHLLTSVRRVCDMDNFTLCESSYVAGLVSFFLSELKPRVYSLLSEQRSEMK